MESTEGDVQTTIVTDVLPKSLLTIDLLTSNLYVVEVIYQYLGTSLEVLLIGRSPPVVLVTCLVKLATLVVETVAHLMTNHTTDTTEVGCIIGCWVEEWRLKDRCWEADLVGGRVIVGIDGLRSHTPL